ncbi:MAG: hypothetical protein DDG60_10975 [Anaerolineae bacterium]|nr:MAG: hypothetical protein DDG60_10975 [Anaerolineae bacterium]
MAASKIKEGLLHALDESFFAEFERGMRKVAFFLTKTYQRQRSLLRSLYIKARLHGDSRLKQCVWDELFPHLPGYPRLVNLADGCFHPDEMVLRRSQPRFGSSGSGSGHWEDPARLAKTNLTTFTQCSSITL